MKKILRSAPFTALLALVLAFCAFPSSGWAALALDGNGHSTGSTSVTLTTSSGSDDIVLIMTVNGTSGSSVSSSNTTGWALRKSQNTGSGNFIEEWVGTASSALSSESITITLAGSPIFITLDAFGISGADTSTIFDGNGALPAGGTTSAVSVTTSNANDFLIGAYRFSGTANPTAGAGWTKISGADFQLVEYQIVSATQSGLSASIGTGNGDENAGIADAIKQSGGGGGPTCPKGMLAMLGVGCGAFIAPGMLAVPDTQKGQLAFDACMNPTDGSDSPGSVMCESARSMAITTDMANRFELAFSGIYAFYQQSLGWFEGFGVSTHDLLTANKLYWVVRPEVGPVPPPGALAHQ